ncbi:MAG: phage major capsid protein [Actinomycetota bacterium]|nr:phage major capsid protein [Actinomycetota bacterium]
MRDPREIERVIDETRAEMQRVLALTDSEMPPQDRRDTVMRMTGAVTELEREARQARDEELEAVRNAVQGGATVGGQSADHEASAAFAAFLSVGEISNAALKTTPDANGGYLMPDAERAEIIDIVRKQNPITQDATLFTLSKPGTFKVDLPKKLTATVAARVAETAARAATNAPTIGKQTLECFEIYANPELTQSFIDAVEGAEDFILSDIADTFAEQFGTETAVGVGSGSNQADGVFAATSYYTTKLSSTIDSLDAAQVLGAYFALPAKFLSNAKFYGNGATFAALSALAWPNLANTPLVRWETGVPTIMGKPVSICDDAPAIGNGLFPLAFGDLKRGYAVGFHTQISTLRDPFTNKPYVGFYTTARMGGVPWDPKAVLLLKSDNA